MANVSVELNNDIYNPESDSGSIREVTQQTIEVPATEGIAKGLWRPALAWSYVLACTFDFVIGPNVSMIFFGVTEQTYIAWVPLTLQGGGLYHLAMGAVLGVTSWSRGQEKIKGSN
jgi:hypothetical protein